ncbi:MAG: hypothetical protein AAF567_16500 [Actinomycetota bacterium]
MHEVLAHWIASNPQQARMEPIATTPVRRREPSTIGAIWSRLFSPRPIVEPTPLPVKAPTSKPASTPAAKSSGFPACREAA